ncbi:MULTISPECIES: NRDE family protein [Microbacterium]|uniref:NRDE family protein n=1 Tax=Microbacterium marmarense TaxID=3122051 RepID=A0ABU8LVP0_9MICO
MCTVIIRVPVQPNDAVRVLAIRDEDPHRPWDRLGEWWPDTHHGIAGVRDARAGGAWLAAQATSSRFAVLLNRADLASLPESELHSRGNIVLDAASGVLPTAPVATHGFNLVTVADGIARVFTWDGVALTETALSPGTHMIAHDGINDESTPRIARWLDQFRSAPLSADPKWWTSWVEILDSSTTLDSTDDRAIIRDNRPHGYPTLSLLACAVSVSASGVDARYGELAEPGKWGSGIDLA